MCQDGGGRCWGREGRRRPCPLLRSLGRRRLPGTAGRARREGCGSRVGCVKNAGPEVRAPVCPVPTPRCLAWASGLSQRREPAGPAAPGSAGPGCGAARRGEGAAAVSGLFPQNLGCSGWFRVGRRDTDAVRGPKVVPGGAGGREGVPSDFGHHGSPLAALLAGQGCFSKLSGATGLCNWC